MERSLVEHWFRKRYAFPLVLAVAVALLVTSEWTSRYTAEIARNSSRMTDTRVAIARILQLVAEADAAYRGVLMGGTPEALAAYHAAKSELPALAGSINRYTQDPAAQGQQAAARLAGAVVQQLEAYDDSIASHQSGQAESTETAARLAHGRAQMNTLRGELEAQLTRTAASQQEARRSIQDVILIGRLSVGALTVLSVCAMYFFLRQLHQQDRERAAQQAHLHTEHERLEREVLARTAELRELARHLQTAREDERAHLARELHDELGALLTAAKLDVARLRSKLAQQPELMERIELLTLRLNEGIALKRRIIEDLRPSSLSNLGLTSALEILCREAGDRLGVPVKTQLEGVQLSSDAELAVFRFVQEALTNIAKYAHAKSVEVRLGVEDGRAVAQVDDDGIGFDDKRRRNGRHGLAGMRFRVESLGGRMAVRSHLGQGTHLRAELPQRVDSEAPAVHGARTVGAL